MTAHYLKNNEQIINSNYDSISTTFISLLLCRSANDDKRESTVLFHFFQSIISKFHSET